MSDRPFNSSIECRTPAMLERYRVIRANHVERREPVRAVTYSMRQTGRTGDTEYRLTATVAWEPEE